MTAGEFLTRMREKATTRGQLDLLQSIDIARQRIAPHKQLSRVQLATIAALIDALPEGNSDRALGNDLARILNEA